MYNLQLTPQAEAAYAARAAAFDETIEEYVNNTLLTQLSDGGYIDNDGNYVPTPEETKLIQEGLDDIAAARVVSMEEAFAAARAAIWEQVN